MLKYLVKGRIVDVHGEEEYMVSHLNFFRYVEMDGEFIETLVKTLKRFPKFWRRPRLPPVPNLL